MFTMGSLFDGAGVFPMAAQMCSITPIWASEVEPFPIAVTSKRFPEMKHLGDVRGINGAEIEPVDVISFGSPCQGLSVCGKFGGLEDERSALFLEAIRIIKEMKNATTEYPRFAVWENVVGAFTSNKGKDFQTVLEEFSKISGEHNTIPESAIRNEDAQKWSKAGLILGDNFSIAWRVLDAQFWGVPHKRRRIFLVADFMGHCAGKVLFVRDGVSRNFNSIRRAWEEDTGPYGEEDPTCGERVIDLDFEGHPSVDLYLKPVVTDFYFESETCLFRDVSAGSKYENLVVRESDTRLRKLMPHECGKLQGMPSWWCYDVTHSDSEEYKMWGNSVALPCALYVFEGIVHELYKTVIVDEFCEVFARPDTFREERYYQYTEDEMSATLKASGGSFGGGSETIALQSTDDMI